MVTNFSRLSTLCTFRECLLQIVVCCIRGQLIRFRFRHSVSDVRRRGETPHTEGCRGEQSFCCSHPRRAGRCCACRWPQTTSGERALTLHVSRRIQKTVVKPLFGPSVCPGTYLALRVGYVGGKFGSLDPFVPLWAVAKPADSSSVQHALVSFLWDAFVNCYPSLSHLGLCVQVSAFSVQRQGRSPDSKGASALAARPSTAASTDPEGPPGSDQRGSGSKLKQESEDGGASEGPHDRSDRKRDAESAPDGDRAHKRAANAAASDAEDAVPSAPGDHEGPHLANRLLDPHRKIRTQE